MSDDLCPHGWPPEFCGNCHEEEADENTRLCAHHRCEVCGPALNSRLREAVEALRRIAAGHAHPSKLAGEALDALPPDDNVYDPPYIERGQ